MLAGRHALRSSGRPAVVAGAVLVFRRGLLDGEKWSAPSPLHPFTPSPLHPLASGVLLGLTIYTYIPARVMWLAFPALALYLIIAGRRGGMPDARRVWAGLGITLLVALVVAAPLLLYLADNPLVEVRIDELSAPLDAAAAGDFAPLWANARGALRLFTIEGDHTWRYNIPGKPFLGPVMGMLFYAGLFVAGWLMVSGYRNRASSAKPGFYGDNPGPGAFLALVWLALGFAPVLVTGPGLSSTKAICCLPVPYGSPRVAAYGLWVVAGGLTA